MHDLIKSSRFQAAFAKLDLENENEVVPAIRALRAMLAKEGETFRSLAELMAKEAAPPQPSDAGRGQAAPGWEETFRDSFWNFGQKPTPQADSRSRPQSRPGRIFQGRDIPTTLRGRVYVQDGPRPTRTGQMLVVTIDGSDGNTYAPIVCFDDTLIEMLQTAERAGAVVDLRVKPSTDPAYMPFIISVKIAG